MLLCTITKKIIKLIDVVKNTINSGIFFKCNGQRKALKDKILPLAGNKNHSIFMGHNKFKRMQINATATT